MTSPPTLPPHDRAEAGIAALLGALLWALLAALLGRARVRARAADMDYRGVTVVVLCVLAEAEAVPEPYVEWIAVPAPWRNGRLLPRAHARAWRSGVRGRGQRAGVPARGPPWPVSHSGASITGMA